MKYLFELVNDEESRDSLCIPIYSLCYDSRRVRENSIFFAIKGFTNDGNNYVDEAIKEGAVAVVSEGRVPEGVKNIYWKQVNDVRESMALISSKFYKEMMEKLYLVGITGTNGKTTTSYLISHILEMGGKRSGVVGTLGMKGMRIGSVSNLTTPESIDLHQYFSELVDNGFRYAIMEVSSHSIALKRIYYLPFKLGIFTNLTRDHLDFHKSIEEYFQIKRKLFLNEIGTELQYALINADDEYGRRILKERKELGIVSYSYGFNEASDYRILDYDLSDKGINVRVNFEGKEYKLRSSLIGIPNIYNLVSASAAAVLMGVDADIIQDAVAAFKGVRGRYERVDYGQKFLVLIDYAHTEDAIENLLRMVRRLIVGKVIIVFGCGGDRDQGKRRLMGRAAAENADYLIITSDNPRSEDPISIIEMILEGVKEVGCSFYEVIVDREAAIYRAVEVAEDNDVVVLAGKGHEDYQIIGKVKLYFDEREIVKRAIRKFGKY